MPRLIPLLDEDLFAANPKAVCGYSDLTMLHLAASPVGKRRLVLLERRVGDRSAGGERLLEEEPPPGALQ